MKIKEREESSFFYYFKKVIKSICRGIFNRKTKILFFIIFIIIFLLLGTFFGLIMSGFFGTFDEPSRNLKEMLNYIGIKNLWAMKIKVKWILEENIKIPINYIRGKFSNPEKIYIDIGFKDYQKIEYKRQQALENGYLICSAEDYVPAKIRYNNKEINVKLRLKGDSIDHIKGDKWSFRIKIKNDATLFGMKIFSIQAPETRNYLNEYIYHQALKKEGVLFLRYKFVEVIINGKNKGIYALEEHFAKELIEHNNRRAGIILKYNEDLFWEEEQRATKSCSDKELGKFYQDNLLKYFYSAEIENFNKKDLEDPALSKQFNKAKNLLELFRLKKLTAEEVFDTGILAKYFAINTLMGAYHASEFRNIRFYYNPITSKLEPVGYDANIAVYSAQQIMDIYLLNYPYKEIKYPHDLFFRDKIFFKKYLQELNRISKKSYLDDLFLELDKEIKNNINIMHKDNSIYHYSTEMFYRNQEQIRNKLDPIMGVKAYFKESLLSQHKIILSVGNNINFPIEIINLIYNNSMVFELNQSEVFMEPQNISKPIIYKQFEFYMPKDLIWNESFVSDLKINYKIFGLEDIKNESILPGKYVEEDFIEKDFIRKKPNINESDINILRIENSTKSIFIKKGKWNLEEDLIIPKDYTLFCEKGTKINLINNASILSYSDLQFSGTENEPIEIISSDGTGQGITVMNSDKMSNFKYVIFNNLTNPSKGGWELTGAINFYKSPVNLEDVYIKRMNAEDSLNIINTNFKIKNISFEDCFSDCFDSDFSNGTIENSLFKNCGNDCIDISGSKIEVKKIEMINAIDKGISAGEKSNLTIENVKIENENKGFIGVASKDNSFIFIKNLNISNSEYGFAIYQKKPEFGAAEIKANDIIFFDIDNKQIVERDSNLLMNNVIVLNKEDKVYKKLYGV